MIRRSCGPTAREAVRPGTPELAVLGGAKADVPDVSGCGKVVGKNSHQRVTQVRVEEKLHGTELARRRSRAAAKASAARMSQRDRSGKSFKISSSLIPAARYSRMS